MAGKPWFTNGEIEIQLNPSIDNIPNGFYRGRKPLNDEQKYLRLQKFRDTMSSKSDEDLYNLNQKKSNSLKRTFANKTEEEKQTIVAKRLNTMNSKSDEDKELYRKNLSDKSKGKNLGKEPWNKGLTKETDDRVKLNAYHTSLTNLNKALQIKITNPSYYKDWRDKVSQSMRTNNTYGKSKPEDDYYEYLLKVYNEEDIIRQYSDSRYPFNCDFYIKSEDKFIEINKHWTHGSHPFDKNNLNDICQLEDWQELSKTSKFYKNAIYVWTDLDVRKLKIAQQNNLKYEVIY